MNFFGNKRHHEKSTNMVTEVEIKHHEKNSKSVIFKTTPGIEPFDMNSGGPEASNQNKHLNNYINELVKENERLQNVIDDLRTTTMLSKQILNEYVNQINEQNEDIKALKQHNAKLAQDVNWLNAQLKSIKSEKSNEIRNSDLNDKTEKRKTKEK